jgi:FAD/FMN-containing dehydrogenase
LIEAQRGVVICNDFCLLCKESCILLPFTLTAPCCVSAGAVTPSGYFEKAKAVLAKYESGARYNGYVSLDDNVASYFQGNYAKLRRTKKKYDPENIFRNPLSVPPAAGAASDE